MTTIYLVRHGQASFAGDEYDLLSDLGHRQGELLGLQFAERTGLRIVSGTMRRHRQTATAFALAAGLADAPSIMSGWNEFDYLDVIGLHRPDLRDHAALRDWAAEQTHPTRAFQSLYQEAVARWVAFGARSEGYRESYDHFCIRIGNALSDVIGSRPPGDVVVFTSGGPIGVVVGMLLDIPPQQRWRLDRTVVNTGITRLNVVNGRPNLATFNSYDHLEDDHALVTYR